MVARASLPEPVAAALVAVRAAFDAQLLLSTDRNVREALLVVAAKVELAFEKHFDKRAVRAVWQRPSDEPTP